MTLKLARIASLSFPKYIFHYPQLGASIFLLFLLQQCLSSAEWKKQCLPSLFPFSMLKSSWCKGILSSRARQCVPSFIYNNFVRWNARCVGGRGECVQRLTAKAWKWRADVNRASGFYLNRDHLYIMLKHLFISCFHKRTRSILFSYIAGVRAHHYRVARDRYIIGQQDRSDKTTEWEGQRGESDGVRAHAWERERESERWGEREITEKKGEVLARRRV